MIETARLKEASEEAIKQWFTVFAEVMDENAIEIGNVYNVDETGNAMGTMERANVIVDAMQTLNIKDSPAVKSGLRQWNVFAQMAHRFFL